MTEDKLEKIYRILRIIIYFIPALAVAAGLYLALFPVDVYRYYPDDPKLSKFEISRNFSENNLSFGVFPVRNYRFIQLEMNFSDSNRDECDISSAKAVLRKTYQAFMYPTAETVDNKENLHRLLFDQNETKYPNGSLLHLKPTNEVFFISHGKKILFPGPEIFEAFGYSFNNLVDVDQSEIEKYSNADPKEFLWTIPHPDGTIFQAFPSHLLYLVFDGKKYLISDKNILDDIWPQNYSIPVSDYRSDDSLNCMSNKNGDEISCRFDSTQLSSIGRYYFFTVSLPPSCPAESASPKNSSLRFYSDRSIATVKESMKNIAASVLNRYFYKQ